VDEVMLYSGCIYAQEGLKDYDVDFLIQEMLRKIRMEAKSSIFLSKRQKPSTPASPCLE